MSKKDCISLGTGGDESRISKAWLLSKKEDEAVRLMSHEDKNRVRKAWKIAHGLTVPDYIKAEGEDKPKRKRTTKKKKEAQD